MAGINARPVRNGHSRRRRLSLFSRSSRTTDISIAPPAAATSGEGPTQTRFQVLHLAERFAFSNSSQVNAQARVQAKKRRLKRASPPSQNRAIAVSTELRGDEKLISAPRATRVPCLRTRRNRPAKRAREPC
jgi:hypothetical protein